MNGIESDRQLGEETQYNLAYRWFCNLNLEDKVPDHSSLTRIRDRFELELFHKFFQLFSGRSDSREINQLKSFNYDEESNRYQCVAGHYLIPYPTISNDTIMYHSNYKDCAACALKIICKAKPKELEMYAL